MNSKGKSTRALKQEPHFLQHRTLNTQSPTLSFKELNWGKCFFSCYPKTWVMLFPGIQGENVLLLIPRVALFSDPLH